ncbi:hypothetical protein BO71DRAFT_177534 [Aspergillus ellipticus CBS 707.79]|uniref:Uncharacterized protein n=1 Tax=Aspergillus ellipticus CBS 707.79 TaxID=1448320 RepID=A0A319CQD2_9EURO|nr:hypothetical protein BO71DRAFT_177534 [Aspergillus ellipticus CBS 707.79]
MHHPMALVPCGISSHILVVRVTQIHNVVSSGIPYSCLSEAQKSVPFLLGMRCLHPRHSITLEILRVNLWLRPRQFLKEPSAFEVHLERDSLSRLVAWAETWSPQPHHARNHSHIPGENVASLAIPSPRMRSISNIPDRTIRTPSLTDGSIARLRLSHPLIGPCIRQYPTSDRRVFAKRDARPYLSETLPWARPPGPQIRPALDPGFELV